MNQITTVWELWTVEFMLSVVPSGVVSVRFQKTDRAAMADRRRSCSPRGVHALSKSPCCASELQMKANVSPLARSLAISPCHLLPPREHGDWDAMAAAEPKIHLNRAPWSDSSKPQPHRELLHVFDPTVIPFFVSGRPPRERGSTGSP